MAITSEQFDRLLNAAKGSSSSTTEVSKGKAPQFVPKPEKYNKEKHGKCPKIWFDTVQRYLQLSGVDPKDHFIWYFDGSDALWLTREVERLTKESRFDLASLRASFLRQYDMEECSVQNNAREKLHNGKIVMSEGAEVRAYVRDFREVARDAEDMSTLDLIHWFKRGLTKSLREKCAVQPDGHDWQSLDALIDYAFGQENRVKLEHQSKNTNEAVVSHDACHDSTSLVSKKRAASVAESDTRLKGQKCYRCHKYGHLASDCKKLMSYG